MKNFKGQSQCILQSGKKNSQSKRWPNPGSVKCQMGRAERNCCVNTDRERPVTLQRTGRHVQASVQGGLERKHGLENEEEEQHSMWRGQLAHRYRNEKGRLSLLDSLTTMHDVFFCHDIAIIQNLTGWHCNVVIHIFFSPKGILILEHHKAIYLFGHLTIICLLALGHVPQGIFTCLAHG